MGIRGRFRPPHLVLHIRLLQREAREEARRTAAAGRRPADPSRCQGSALALTTPSQRTFQEKPVLKHVHGVPAFMWNPHRYRRLRLAGRMFGPRKNNFGDLIGPQVVAQVAESRLGSAPHQAVDSTRTLFSVGSVMHFAGDNDVIWGTGVNGKTVEQAHRFTRLDVRAVRGPLTREWLRRERGIDAPEVYGDPALLLGDRLRARHPLLPSRRLSVIPNLNDAREYRSHPDFFSPRRSVDEIAARIAGSEALVTSSLHALVFAEMLGVPVVLIASPVEPVFKYEDYFRGTGRSSWMIASNLDEALQLLPARTASTEAPLAAWDPAPLEAAFPTDLWTTAS
ncbi:polysaccharide pyruvyl transferase family protein [Pseudoclavibacter sp. RFBI5]|nr:polysaccharide pyruvyl transferase family protein [Pseudoclavibacter sp. RFBI5]